MSFSGVTSRRLRAIDNLNSLPGPEYVSGLLEDYMPATAGEVHSEVSGFVGRKFKVVTFEYQGNYRTAIFFSGRVRQHTSLRQHSRLVLDLPIEGNGEAALRTHRAVIKYLEAA